MNDAWVRDTVGRTANAAVFMTIEAGTADRLTGASTAVAKKTDLMMFEGASGAMRMSYVDGMNVSADKPLSLDPSGLHVWLADLNAPLTQGQSFPLTLRFAKAGERRILVKVIGPSERPPVSMM